MLPPEAAVGTWLAAGTQVWGMGDTQIGAA